VLVAIFVTLVALSVIILQARGRARRQTAIDAIKMTREALMPSDLKTPADRTGRDPSEWLASTGSTRNLWEIAALSDLESYQQARDAGATGRAEDEARIAFERFESCIRPVLAARKDSNAAWSEFWVGVATQLRTADGTAAWTDCQAEAVQLLATGLAPSMKLARAAAGLGPIDPQRVTRALDQADAGFPELPFTREVRIADAVEATALFDAQSKRFAAALDDVRAGLDVADVHRPSHWLLGYAIWTMHVGRALDSLQLILPLLPRGIDVTDIEARLTALRPGEELATALRGERAYGYRVFESLRSGWTPKGGASFAPSSLLARMHRWLVGDEDEAAYLEAMTSSIERAQQPAFLRKEAMPAPPTGFMTPVTSQVMPALDGMMSASDLLAARLALARMALAAYRGGAQDALTFLSKSIDPYTGLPLQWGTGENELVAFWSVGPDRKDNNASPDSDDVRWALRLRD
jgi:hypothetical protein